MLDTVLGAAQRRSLHRHRLRELLDQVARLFLLVFELSDGVGGVLVKLASVRLRVLAQQVTLGFLDRLSKLGLTLLAFCPFALRPRDGLVLRVRAGGQFS